MKIGLFIGLILVVPLCVYAASDVDWSDEENREEAWTVYLMTEWENTGTLVFTEDGSYSKTIVNENFVNDYKTIVIETLGECTKQGQYNPEDYQNLILTIMYYLQDNASDDYDIDIACVKEFINPSATVTSQKISIKLLYQRICQCENDYNIANIDNPCNIFQNNEQLGGMIQSVIYPGFNQTYTKKKAKKYYNDNLKDNNVKKYHEFAKDVTDHYKAVQGEGDNSNNHVIPG